MSDTIRQNCECCQTGDDCINGLCQCCSSYLDKQIATITKLNKVFNLNQQLMSEMTIKIEDLTSRLIAHQKGQSVAYICEDCLKNIWFVDDKNMKYPFCGKEGFHHLADEHKKII